MFGLENSANNFGASAGLLANTLANRPVQAALGTLFIGTDNLLIYRYNGSSWILIGGGGAGIINAVNGLSKPNATSVGFGGILNSVTNLALNSFFLQFTDTLGDVLSFDTIQNLYYFGKGRALGSGLGFEVDGQNNRVGVRYNANFGAGLFLDFTTKVFQFGDNYLAGTNLTLDANNNVFYTSYNTNLVGFYFDYTNLEYKFGDFGGLNNNTSFFINDLIQQIYTKNNSGPTGLKIDLFNRISTLGDFDLNNNGYYLMIDDVNGTLNFTGTNLESLTSGGNSGKYLVIRLNGNPYKIRLENP